MDASDLVLIAFIAAALIVWFAHWLVLERACPTREYQVRESRVCYPLVCVCLFGLYAVGLADHQPAYFSAYVGFLFVLLTIVIPFSAMTRALGWTGRRAYCLASC